MFIECSLIGKELHSHYIRLNITPTLTYLRTSLQTSLQNQTKREANRKMTSLRSGVKMGLMKKKEESGIPGLDISGLISKKPKLSLKEKRKLKKAKSKKS